MCFLHPQNNSTLANPDAEDSDLRIVELHGDRGPNNLVASWYASLFTPDFIG